jgi:hypothetical protein
MSASADLPDPLRERLLAADPGQPFWDAVIRHAVESSPAEAQPELVPPQEPGAADGFTTDPTELETSPPGDPGDSDDRPSEEGWDDDDPWLSGPAGGTGQDTSGEELGPPAESWP